MNPEDKYPALMAYISDRSSQDEKTAWNMPSEFPTLMNACARHHVASESIRRLTSHSLH
jgi:hypothetical protein